MPNLENFAEESMHFRNAYTGAPQCAPSRVCIQTGMTSARSGFTVYQNGENSYPEKDSRDPLNKKKKYKGFPVIPCISDLNLDRFEPSIANVLKPLGYKSAHFGKWHMRGDGPGDHGYDEHDGDTNNNPGNKKIPDDPKLIFSMTDKSVKFIKKNVKSDNPFYLQVSHYALHKSYRCLPKSESLYNKNPFIADYYKDDKKEERRLKKISKTAKWFGMAKDMDTGIGKVLETVKKLNIQDNTYIIITSDNGYRHWSRDMDQPLRGAKWWVWDGGLRVPMWMRGPGIKAGSLCTKNVVNYDFLPTFIDLAGGDIKKTGIIDGISLKPIIIGEKLKKNFDDRNLYFHYPHYRTSVPHSAIVSGKWKCLHFYENPELKLLFDLSSDVGESTNLADKYPKKQKQLYDEMMTYFKDVNARIPKPNPQYSYADFKAQVKQGGKKFKKSQEKRDEWRWKKLNFTR